MTRETFTIAAVAFVCQRSSQLAAGDAISFRIPHAYIKKAKEMNGQSKSHSTTGEKVRRKICVPIFR
jgi:hypothetical protein